MTSRDTSTLTVADQTGVSTIALHSEGLVLRPGQIVFFESCPVVLTGQGKNRGAGLRYNHSSSMIVEPQMQGDTPRKFSRFVLFLNFYTLSKEAQLLFDGFK